MFQKTNITFSRKILQLAKKNHKCEWIQIYTKNISCPPNLTKTLLTYNGHKFVPLKTSQFTQKDKVGKYIQTRKPNVFKK